MAKKDNLQRLKYEVAQEFGLTHRENHPKMSHKNDDKVKQSKNGKRF